MTTADLIAFSEAGSPSCGVYDAGASASVYGNSFLGSSSFAGPIRFDPTGRHFCFLHNGTGGGGYGGDGQPRLFRWNGTTWVRDAADVPGVPRCYGVTWHRGDLIMRPIASGNVAMWRFDLATNTATSFSLPGSGSVSGIDVIGDVLYYLNGTANTINRYNLATSSALSPLTVAAGIADYDVRNDGRLIMATSSSAYVYSAVGTLVSIQSLPGTGTVRCIRWSKGDPSHYWVQRAGGVYEVDGAGALVRSVGLSGMDQIDVLAADAAPVLTHVGAMTT